MLAGCLRYVLYVYVRLSNGDQIFGWSFNIRENGQEVIGLILHGASCSVLFGAHRNKRITVRVCVSVDVFVRRQYAHMSRACS